MKILEALKHDETNMRLSYGDRWLVWKCRHKVWVVLERKPYARTTDVVIQTEHEEVAIRALINDPEITNASASEEKSCLNCESTQHCYDFPEDANKCRGYTRQDLPTPPEKDADG